MKKKLVIILPIVLGLLAVGAGVLSYLRFNKPEEVVETGNLANVEWYSQDEKEFTIDTVEEFYEFAKLSQFYDFEKQIVKLEADLVLNEGTAADWEKEAPARKWIPIQGFKGTFDGQGHTISGVYSRVHNGHAGLFSDTQTGCHITDFKLLNSYFEASGEEVGSVASNGSGKFSNIYSDAIVVSDNKKAGGIIGEINAGGKNTMLQYIHTVSNCWFAGEVRFIDLLDSWRGGGIVGTVANGTLTVEHCLNTGTISGPMNHMGGIVGYTIHNSGVVVYINDCFNSGKIDAGYDYAIGSVVGRVGGKTTVTLTNTAATLESCKDTVFADGTKNGYVIQRPEAELSGLGGYQWTNLDFENYWAIRTDSTPVLKYFTDDIPDLTGVVKEFSVDWYDKNQNEYVLNTRADLFGFQLISQITDFEGKKVMLGSDITYNEGKASKWGKKAPEYEWKPIGTFKVPFAGTFDGQGHSISGIYIKVDDQMGTGMFRCVGETGAVKNIKILNSYIESSYDDGLIAIAGVIAGRAYGTYERIYTDAILVTHGGYTGGLIGQTAGNLKVSECWFDGSVTVTGVVTPMKEAALYIGGFIGSAQGATTAVTKEILHCLNTGTITGPLQHVGGFVGYVSNPDNEVVIKDCLGAGKIISGHPNVTGSIVGRVGREAKLTLEDTVATTESCVNTIFADGGDKPAIVVGAVGQRTAKQLTGNGGYEWSELNFNKYWSIVKDSTPILKCFAKSSPSTKGLVRRFSTKWYDPKKDTYTINTLAELNGFNSLLQTNDFKGKTIKLGADITVNTGNAADWAKQAPEYQWLPGNTFNAPFAGTFDGQGHTISGLYIKDDKMGVGMFRSTGATSVVKDFKLVNSYIESSLTDGDIAIIGAISGRGQGTIERVYTDAIIESYGGYAGGFIGQCAFETKISECWFDGSVNVTAPKGMYVGGFIGSAQNANKKEIVHCLNSGSVTNKMQHVGGFVGFISNAGNEMDIIDCLNVGIIKSGYDNVTASIVGRVQGKATLKLLGTSATLESEKHTFYADIGDNPAIVKGTVVQRTEAELTGNGGYEWSELDFNNYWSIVKKGTPILKYFAQESPSIAGLVRRVDTSWYDVTKDTYIIDTFAKLNGFNALAQKDDFKGKTVKLGADITVNTGDAKDWKNNAPKYQWMPMNTLTKPFAGTFDGQGHTISGLYIKDGEMGMGMFRCIDENSVIKDFKLVNSYIESTLDSGNIAIAGVIAGRGMGTIERVYTDAILVTYGGYTGGFIGQSAGNLKFSECWFDGSVTVTGADSLYIGGFIGSAQGGLTAVKKEISHSLNTGTVTGQMQHVGGFAGFISNPDHEFVISDCLGAGKVISGHANVTGSIVGRVGKDAKLTIKNTSATAESCINTFFADGAPTIAEGTVIKKTVAELTGNKGYQWTELDFDKYWSIVADSTPILKYFATTSPAVSGERMIATSWYNSADDTYIIDSVAKLNGFNAIAQKEDFKGKTVKLAADITLNTGDAKDWKNDAPEAQWLPTNALTKPFAGTFDGQGHTISGLYIKDGEMGMGMFRCVDENSVIKDFKLVNSYIESTLDSGDIAIAGVIVGRGQGTIERVYTDAILVTYGGYTGGFVGQSAGHLKISECWFDGSVTVTGADSLYIGGFIGSAQGGTTAVKKEISHSLNTGTVTGQMQHVGGFVGFISNPDHEFVISDCLGAGKVVSGHANVTGSIVGRVGKDAKLTIERTSATAESCANTFFADGAPTIAEGTVIKKTVAELKGNKGYQWTELDFDNYWSIVADSTPVLKYFATSSPAVSGERMIDTSWYNTTDTVFNLDTPAKFNTLAAFAQNDTFAGKTINLLTDVTINTGNAADWGTTAPESIWVPIGAFTKAFEGTFNGNMHTISGLYSKLTQGSGLFQRVGEQGKVQNLKLTNSYFESDLIVAGIAARGSGIFENIYTDAIVKATNNGSDYGYAGGIVGQGIGNLYITNSWNAGPISTENQALYVGGFVGSAEGTKVEISAGLNTGAITAGRNHAGGFVGFVGQGEVLVDNSLNTGKITAAFEPLSSIIGRVPASRKVTFTNVYASSESCANTIFKDPNSIIVGEATKVDNLIGINGYRNTTLDFKNRWVAIEGKTPELDTFKTGEPIDLSNEEAKVTADTSWYSEGTKEYTLTTVAQLMGLSELVGVRAKTFKGVTVKLGADITFNTGNAADWATTTPQNKWTPIGSFSSTTFQGVFDGQGHTISGLYHSSTDNFVALFGGLNNATVKNVSLKNSYFASTGICVGGIAGRAQSSTLEKVYVDAIVTTSGGYVGGLIGQATGDSATVKECCFAGSVSSTGEGYRTGGIIGHATATEYKISYCLNKGTVSAPANAHVGGIIGFLDNGTATIDNCLNTGSITSTGLTKGAIVGRMRDWNYADIIVKNTYAYSGSCTGVLYADKDAFISYGYNCSDDDLLWAMPEAQGDCSEAVIKLSESNLTGEAAKTHAPYLNWATYWKTTETFPMLKNF